MKKTSLYVFIFLFASMQYGFAQKAKVQAASNYLKYDQLDKAKEAIDEAVKDPKSGVMERTWYIRGLVYMSLFNNEKYGTLCERCMVVASESFKKAQDLDPKSEWADSSKAKEFLLKLFLFNDGAERFNNGEYKKALDDFEQAVAINPEDKDAVMNSAISADKAGDNAKATMYYQKLVDLKGADSYQYQILANLYKDNNDTVRALKIIREGRQVFPDSLNLMIAEINVLIPMGKSKEATDVIESALAKEPNNYTLYLALGNMYDNLANQGDGQQRRSMNYTEYINKAEQAYLKGLQYKPDNFELNYNIGAIYFNQAAEYYNSANAVPLEQQAKHKELMDKSESTFRKAQPYLEKAHELKPEETGIVSTLKELYLKTGQNDKAANLK